MIKELITFEIIVLKADRKSMHKLLTEQIGITLVRFEETKTDFSKFKVTCETVYHCYQLGLMWGRAQILAKTNIE